MVSKHEYEYARLVSEKSKKPIDEVIETMTEARDVYGVSFKNYHNIRLYNYTTKTIFNNGVRLKELAEATEKHYSEICEATGKTKSEIDRDLLIFNGNPYTTVDIAQYNDLKLYEVSWNKKEQILKAIQRRRQLTSLLKADLEKIDLGLKSYGDIKNSLDEFYECTKLTLLKSELEEISPFIEQVDADALNDEKLFREIATDFLICKRLLGFLDFEYVMFDLWRRSFEEKRTYASNSFRMEKVCLVNDRIKSDIFDNKALTYEIFKDFFNRDIISVYSNDDYGLFLDFCKKHPVFVKKPLAGSMGSGVAKVETDSNTNFRKLFDDMREEMIEFLCEELVICHPGIRELNPDSVNTVRLTTYHDGSKTHIVWPWMKIGRAGSFVDNAGSGGMCVAIDIETGKLYSYGVDEHGHLNYSHPDSGLKFEGYQLPNWEGALELGEAISERLVNSIEGVKFVGWDITCNEDGKWIVIEGNTFPQLVQQASYGRGLKEELDELIRF